MRKHERRETTLCIASWIVLLNVLVIEISHKLYNHTFYHIYFINVLDLQTTHILQKAFNKTEIDLQTPRGFR